MVPQDCMGDLPAKDQPVKVEISRNKMEAYLSVCSPPEGQPVSRQDIIDALQSKGVVYGVNDEIIDLALKLQKVLEPLTIARGTEPVPGENARIEYMFSTDATIKPTELVDGRVDYYNLNLIHNVDPGQMLAVKRPLTAGNPGSTVTGEEIPAKPGKDVQLLAGKNVELVSGDTVGYAADDVVVTATAQGHVILTGNKVSVSNVYEVGGDVDFNTGNIEFNGSVVIKGSIREGFKVVANGDVIVMNSISDGIVECAGSVKVKNGIIGRSRSRIKAADSVLAKFVENAVIECGGDVLVGEAIMHSKVNAGKSVAVGGKGVLVGGQIRSGEDINCKVLGSHLATATEVEVGINPEVRKEYSRLLKEKESKENDHDKAQKAINMLKRMQSAEEMHPDKRALLVQVTKVQISLARELETINESLRNLEFQIQQSDRGRIMVQGTIYPGVKVTMGSSVMQIKDALMFVTITKHGAEIRISPYK